MEPTAARAVAAPAVRETLQVRRAEPVTPIKVAYLVPRQIPAQVPPPQPSVDEEEQNLDRDSDQNQDYEESEPPTEWRGSRPIVEGKRAILRNGIAYAPSRAPQSIKNTIWAVNSLRRKPYVWGGGHGSFDDDGYDCSGAVSFALHYAGVLAAPLPSTDLMRYGKRGRGRWITIYSRDGHTFAVIAGLRLDTTELRGRGGDVGPRWYAEERSNRGFVARHPAGL